MLNPQNIVKQIIRSDEAYSLAQNYFDFISYYKKEIKKAVIIEAFQLPNKGVYDNWFQSSRLTFNINDQCFLKLYQCKDEIELGFRKRKNSSTSFFSKSMKRHETITIEEVRQYLFQSYYKSCFNSLLVMLEEFRFIANEQYKEFNNRDVEKYSNVVAEIITKFIDGIKKLMGIEFYHIKLGSQFHSLDSNIITIRTPDDYPLPWIKHNNWFEQVIGIVNYGYLDIAKKTVSKAELIGAIQHKVEHVERSLNKTADKNKSIYNTETKIESNKPPLTKQDPISNQVEAFDSPIKNETDLQDESNISNRIQPETSKLTNQFREKIDARKDETLIENEKHKDFQLFNLAKQYLTYLNAIQDIFSEIEKIMGPILSPETKDVKSIIDAKFIGIEKGYDRRKNFSSWKEAMSFFIRNKYLKDNVFQKRLESFRAVEHKIDNFERTFYLEFLYDYLSSLLIYLEELNNIFFFFSGIQDRSKNFKPCETLIKKVIDSCSRYLGLNLIYVPLFAEAKDFIGNFYHVNEEVSELYKRITLPKGYIWEIKRFGYDAKNQLLSERTEVIVS